MENKLLQNKLIEHYNSNKGPLLKDDFEFLFYIKWRGLLTALCETAKELYIKLKNLEIENSEIEQYDQYANLMQILKELFSIIGEVNTYELSEKWSFGKTIIAYFYSLKKEKKEDRLEIFILKIENYLARKIIIQSSIPISLLDAENEDIKTTRSLSRNIRKLKNIQTNEEKDVVPLEENLERRIEFADFVVRTYALKCVHNHEVKQIRALIEVMNNNGEIKPVTIPAAYCEDCSCYFILETDFQKARQLGVLLCQQLTEEVYRLRGDEIINGDSLKPESLLHQCGYNVSSSEDLTITQRREILRRVADNGLYSISGLCSHLNWLISRNKRVINRDMSSAITKWEQDREYISKYSLQDKPIVKVKTVTTN